MGHVRELTEVDRDEARRLARLKDRTSGSDPITDDALDYLMGVIGHPESGRRLFGYFEDSTLVSWLAVRYLMWFNETEQTEEKVWLIVGMFTRSFHNHFSFKRPEFGMLIKGAFDFAEANGYYKYVYSIAKRLEDVYERQFAKQSFMPMIGRYELHNIGVVHAGTPAPTDWQQRMMGGIKSDDISFKMRVLKPEYRK